MTFLLAGSTFAAAPPTDPRPPRLIGGHMSVSWLIYAVAPDTLCAWNNANVGRALEMQKLFVRPDVLAKEVVGSRTMGGMNTESLLLQKPTAIILADFVRREIMSPSLLKNANIEVINLKFGKLEDYPDSLRAIGQAAHAPERANRLAKFVENLLSDLHQRVGSIPDKQRVKVYYASSPNGMETAAGNTVHDYVISYAGGVNVFPPGSALNKVRFKVTMEQILEYNPDVIIVNDREFAGKIRSLPGWSHLPAVKNGKVYLIPDAPVSWMDRPVSMFQLLGAWWLATKLYPEKFPEGYRPMTEKFFANMLQVKLDAEKWRMIATDPQVSP